jgi:hypothetical protein
MGNMEARIRINREARKRVKLLVFGDAVTNICAGEKNPHRHSYFVRRKKDTVECTDKKGNFWETFNDVIYPEHLEHDKCEELFQPVWEAQYGQGRYAKKMQSFEKLE